MPAVVEIPAEGIHAVNVVLASVMGSLNTPGVGAAEADGVGEADAAAEGVGEAVTFLLQPAEKLASISRERRSEITFLFILSSCSFVPFEVECLNAV
jgi:hypothetical protein